MAEKRKNGGVPPEIVPAGSTGPVKPGTPETGTGRPRRSWRAAAVARIPGLGRRREDSGGEPIAGPVVATIAGSEEAVVGDPTPSPLPEEVIRILGAEKAEKVQELAKAVAAYTRLITAPDPYEPSDEDKPHYPDSIYPILDQVETVDDAYKAANIDNTIAVAHQDATTLKDMLNQTAKNATKWTKEGNGTAHFLRTRATLLSELASSDPTDEEFLTQAERLSARNTQFAGFFIKERQILDIEEVRDSIPILKDAAARAVGGRARPDIQTRYEELKDKKVRMQFEEDMIEADSDMLIATGRRKKEYTSLFESDYFKSIADETKLKYALAAIRNARSRGSETHALIASLSRKRISDPINSLYEQLTQASTVMTEQTEANPADVSATREYLLTHAKSLITTLNRVPRTDKFTVTPTQAADLARNLRRARQATPPTPPGIAEADATATVALYPELIRRVTTVGDMLTARFGKRDSKAREMANALHKIDPLRNAEAERGLLTAIALERFELPAVHEVLWRYQDPTRAELVQMAADDDIKTKHTDLTRFVQSAPNEWGMDAFRTVVANVERLLASDANTEIFTVLARGNQTEARADMVDRVRTAVQDIADQLDPQRERPEPVDPERTADSSDRNERVVFPRPAGESDDDQADTQSGDGQRAMLEPVAGGTESQGQPDDELPVEEEPEEQPQTIPANVTAYLEARSEHVRQVDWEMIPEGHDALHEAGREIVAAAQARGEGVGIDLGRLDVLWNVRNEAGKSFKFYRGKLKSRHHVVDKEGERHPDEYIVMVLFDEEGRDIAAFGDSPIMGPHAAFMTKREAPRTAEHGATWEDMFAEDKDFLMFFGARRLLHKAKPGLTVNENMERKARLLIQCEPQQFHSLRLDR